jgi:hypothetical protein
VFAQLSFGNRTGVAQEVEYWFDRVIMIRSNRDDFDPITGGQDQRFTECPVTNPGLQGLNAFLVRQRQLFSEFKWCTAMIGADQSDSHIVK